MGSWELFKLWFKPSIKTSQFSKDCPTIMRFKSMTSRLWCPPKSTFYWIPCCQMFAISFILFSKQQINPMIMPLKLKLWHQDLARIHRNQSYCPNYYLISLLMESHVWSQQTKIQQGLLKLVTWPRLVVKEKRNKAQIFFLSNPIRLPLILLSFLLR